MSLRCTPLRAEIRKIVEEKNKQLKNRLKKRNSGSELRS